MSAGTRALFRRALGDIRVRTLSFTAVFALYAYANVVGYRHSYPTAADRLAFATSFGANRAIRLFYGVPHDLLTTGGYAAWRVGGIATIIGGVWAVLASVRLLRAEEDSGRQELLLAGAVARRTAFLSVVAALLVATVVLGLGAWIGLVGGRLDVGSSALLALSIVSPVPVFAGVGALASQVAGTRRLAVTLGTAALVAAFLLRVVADTASGAGWLRWTTPLGWAEEVQPFGDERPLVLLLPALVAVGLLTLAGRLAARRDVGTGLLTTDDSRAAHSTLLSSPTAQALRAELPVMIGWLLGISMYAAVIGVLSTSFTKTTIPKSLQEQLEKLGLTSITTPSGALGLYFLFFAVGISVFACAQVGALRREEAEQRLETLLAQPVDRHRWLGGRLLLAVGGMAALALTAGAVAWVGAASQHAEGVSLADMLEAGLNTLPTSLLFLGLGVLAFAVVPRASVGIAYALVLVAFLWELIGAALGAPRWLLQLTPYHHVALVPAQAFNGLGAAVALAIAIAAALLALVGFRRRDLVGA